MWECTGGGGHEKTLSPPLQVSRSVKQRAPLPAGSALSGRSLSQNLRGAQGAGPGSRHKQWTSAARCSEPLGGVPNRHYAQCYMMISSVAATPVIGRAAHQTKPEFAASPVEQMRGFLAQERTPLHVEAPGAVLEGRGAGGEHLVAETSERSREISRRLPISSRLHPHVRWTCSPGAHHVSLDEKQFRPPPVRSFSGFGRFPGNAGAKSDDEYLQTPRERLRRGPSRGTGSSKR